MDKYLFRISLKPTTGWSKFYGMNVKPLYYVARTKEDARAWGESNILEGLTITQVSRIATQISNVAFSGNISK